MRAARAIAGGVAAILLLSACNDADQQSEPPPIPDDTPEEPEDDTGEDTDAVNEPDDEIDVSTVPANPEDIDVEYVQAVMDEIDPIVQAAAAIYSGLGDLDDPNFREVLFSAYTEAHGEAQLRSFAAVGPEGFRIEPEAPTTDVQEFFERRSDCLVFSAERSFEPVLAEDADYSPVQPYYIRLRPHEPTELNPTAWRLDFDSYFDDADAVPGADVCES